MSVVPKIEKEFLEELSEMGLRSYKIAVRPRNLSPDFTDFRIKD